MSISRPPGTNTFSIVGWLFADLLLAMVLVFLGAAEGGNAGQVMPQQAPTLHATRTPSPTGTSVKPPPLALSPAPLAFSVFIDPSSLGDPRAVATVKDQVAQQLRGTGNWLHKAGFVITLAGGIQGVEHATAFNHILSSILNFQAAVFKNYHDLGHPPEEFDLEIYFFV
jgi:hypothetical protein